MSQVTIYALISSCGDFPDGPNDPHCLLLMPPCTVSSHNEQSGPIEQVTVCDLQHQVPKASQFWLGHLECSLWEQSAALKAILFGKKKKLPEKNQWLHEISHPKSVLFW